MTAQAASGKKVTPVTMAAVVGEEKTVTQQADKTSAALVFYRSARRSTYAGRPAAGKVACTRLSMEMRSAISHRQPASRSAWM
ncbi:MAG: hypothetical protein ACLURV_01950 [Gallintestinimicrobium sp.]